MDTALQQEWYSKGQVYAQAVNEMVAYTDKHGWDSWKGEEPKDKRSHLAEAVLNSLKAANAQGQVARFREQFPPAHLPFVQMLDQQGQSIQNIHFSDNERLVFTVGSSYQEQPTYILDGQTLRPLKEARCVGKSLENDVFALNMRSRKILLTQGQEGQVLHIFDLPHPNITVTDLLPFPDGKAVLLVSSGGIYYLSEERTQLMMPGPEELEEYFYDETEGDSLHILDMEHAAISPSGNFFCLGHQSSDHLVYNRQLELIAELPPESSYPHFALFAKDESQLIMNACHFYNGATYGVSTKDLPDFRTAEWPSEEERFQTIDEACRVYAGVATKDYYILGDAYGYIRAFDKKGNNLWRYFLGSTISGMALSPDENTLAVGTYAGILHKLKLNKGHRDTHTIGNGKHYEEFRLLMWKEENQALFW
ncbi:hypothetical protein AAG747_06660 [Rapidithrix thailandica]|uniref:Uncharacterized protein n=1 Tax=Rapidithrix thailandica TaxID=413964 RepID=A0AAW9S5F4_9BACT